MRFFQPNAALWLLTVPALWALWLFHRQLRERMRRLSGFGPGIERLSHIAGVRHDLRVVTLITIAAVSLVVAAMRPQMVIWRPSYESRDLLLLLDRSASMQAEDVHPSRARRASLELRNFIRAMPDTIARVGLIGFAGSSVTLSQQTRDSNVVLFYLDWIEEDRSPLFGTNLRAGLENALDLIRKANPPRPTFVVIVSDGDDHGTRLQETVSKFSALRIPIYSIGIGSTEEVPIPAPTGSAASFLLDEEGRPLRTHLDEGTLQAIATATGGRYYRSSSGEELRAALDEVANRERHFVGWSIDRYNDLYPWSLGCGAIALATLMAIL